MNNNKNLIGYGEKMSWTFYTLGGKHYWEDVFFSNGWRIQRHSIYKDYRLIDRHNIRREEGTFNTCIKTFSEYSKAHEMTNKEDRHIVIMLHGLNENKNIYNKMEEQLIKNGYYTAAINYPSTLKDMAAHVRQIHVLLNNTPNISQVSFITKGISAIIIRKAIAGNAEWKKRIKIKKIIQITPPNQGSRFLTKLSQYKLFRWWLGPTISQLSNSQIEKTPTFKKGIELGIISCDYPYKKIATTILPSKIREFMPSQAENDIDYPNKSIYIRETKRTPTKNSKVISATIRFLKDGKF